MKTMKFNKTKLSEAELISSAYGDANIFTRLKILYLRKKHPELKALFCEYKSTAKLLKNIVPEDCPDTLLPTSLKQNRKQYHPYLIKVLLGLINKPALPAAAFLILIFITLFSVLKTSPEQSFSQLEVELANKQVKQTLVLVNSVFRTSTKQLRKNILSEKVANPINEGMNIIEDYIKEKQNETLN